VHEGNRVLGGVANIARSLLQILALRLKPNLCKTPKYSRISIFTAIDTVATIVTTVTIATVQRCRGSNEVPSGGPSKLIPNRGATCR
jgi:hypothetical protein